jgi:RND family efflux transporter MFP subunit
MKKRLHTLKNWLFDYKWWLIIIVIAIGGFLYWQSQQKANEPQLSFAQPQRQTITQSLEASGIIDAKEKVLLRFAAGGKLTYVGAKEGDYIKKYQTIARIDARDLQKRLERTLNIYEQQRNSWDQTLDDTKDRWIPKKEERQVDTNQQSLDNTVIDVELQSIAISNTVMSSPIEGVLVSAPTTIAGVVVTATDTFGIANPNTLVFSAEVDEADIAQVQLGQKVWLSLDAYPDQTLESQVSFIGFRAINTSSGTAFIVEMPILAENALDRYRLGMNGDAKIELARKENALTIPLSATKERNEKVYVDVKDAQGEVVEQEIELGIQNDELVEVLSGLNESSEVVIP